MSEATLQEEFGHTRVLSEQHLQRSDVRDCMIHIMELPPGGVLEFWDAPEEEWATVSMVSWSPWATIPMRALSRKYLRETFGGEEQMLLIIPAMSATIRGVQFVTAAVIKIRDARGNCVPMYKTPAERQRQRY